ncbi:hypothetical protein LMG33818_000542 [Halomonadaceae bacterium LMG 33818]|uniref:hypothetical protein n=1 Tax=Cernens ardua TaxID=3402176 RepID=UPI003EDBEDDB
MAAVILVCTVLLAGIEWGVLVLAAVLPFVWMDGRTRIPALWWDAISDCWYDADQNAINVSAFRLAPGIVGMRLGSKNSGVKNYWVWPDSADAQTLWMLRRALMGTELR